MFADVIDVSVILNDPLCQFRIAIDESVEALLENPLCGRGRNKDVDNRFQFRLIEDFQGAAGDVDAVISDPLDIADNLHCRCDETKIGGNRLFARENLEANVVNFKLKFIDLIVPINDLLR